MATAPSLGASASESPDAPPRQRRRRAVLTIVATMLGLALLALGQYALDEGLQERFENDALFAFMRSPWQPRIAPGVAGIVLGGLLAGLGLWRWVAPYPALERAWTAPHLSRRRLGWALIGLSVAANVALCLHVLTTPVAERIPDETQVIIFGYVRPLAYALVLGLAAVGCALLAYRHEGQKLPFDRWDALWIVVAMALYVGMTAPYLDDPRFSVIGDEYSFLSVAYELASGRPWDPFWQAGVYGVFPLTSSFIQALTMRAFGMDIFGWKMGCVVMGALIVPPTYLAARWLFDRNVARVAAIVIATSHYLWAYGHTGHNNIDGVFPVAMTSLLAVVALTRPSPLAWYLAGAAAGSSFYFFTAARVAGPILGLAMLARGPRKLAEGLPAALFGCLTVLAPFVARNQAETLTTMLQESATTKSSLVEALSEAVDLTALSMLAFHWSTAHGLYISLGLLDPVAAALSALGIVLAVLHFRDWHRRVLIGWYLIILVVTGGLARHHDISVPRLLMAMPALAILVGDAVGAMIRLVGAPMREPARRALGVAIPLLLTAVLTGSNAYRFFVVTPSRNPLPAESLWLTGLYGAQCRQTGGSAIALGHDRGGPLWYAVTSYEPKSYIPLLLEWEEFWRVPAYMSWPCIVMIDSKEANTRRVLAEVRRRNSGAVVSVIPDDSGTRETVVVTQPSLPDPRVSADALAPSRPPFVVHRADPRRFTGPGALHESADLTRASNGHLFAVDRPSGRVTEYDPDGSFVAIWGSPSVLEAPVAAAADETGLLVVDAGRGTLVELDAPGRVRRAIPWADLGLALPRAIVITPDRSVLIADEGQAAIAELDRDLRPIRRLFDPASEPDQTRPFRPTDVAVAPDGSVFAYEGGTAGRVRRVGPDGVVTGTWEVQLREGRVAAAPDGSFWLGGPGPEGLRHFDASGQLLGTYRARTFVGGVGEAGITGLVVDDRGVMHVAWRYPGVISYRLMA